MDFIHGGEFASTSSCNIERQQGVGEAAACKPQSEGLKKSLAHKGALSAKGKIFKGRTEGKENGDCFLGISSRLSHNQTIDSFRTLQTC